MKYVMGDYSISLEQHGVPLFSLTVEDKRHFSTYKGDFDMSIVAKDVKQFEALMKKFFEGRYFMQIEKDAIGLDISFKIVVDEIVMKEFSLQLPLHHQLSEKEEHAARILQLEEKVDRLQKRLDRLELFMEHQIGDPEKEFMVCYFEHTFQPPVQPPVNPGPYGKYALPTATSIHIDFSKEFLTESRANPHISNSVFYRDKLTNWTNSFHYFKFIEEFEVSNYAYLDLDLIFHSSYSSNTIKTVKFTNCQKLTQVNISKEWWNVKTIIFKGCPDIDFEYLFDGKERCPLKSIVLLDRMDRLFERYFTRLQEIGICLKYN
jgi:hypothetical protein